MKKNVMRWGAALTAGIVLFVSLTGCAVFRFHIGRPADSPFQSRSSVTATPQIPFVSSASLPEYYHYNDEEFYDSCDEMLRLYSLGDTGQAFALYDQLNKELLAIDDLQSVAYIKYSENVNDDYYSEEYQYANEVCVAVADRFFTACHDMITGPYKNEFLSYLNDEVCSSYYQDYTAMDEEQRDLFTKENNLVQEYYSQADTLMETACTIEGTTYTFDEVLGENGDALYLRDADLYLEIYEQCLKNYNALVGDTFLELVEVRTQLAESYGYDSYADYADAEIYQRDYSESDLQAMKDAVKYYAEDLQKYQYYFSEESDFSYTDTSDLILQVGSILSAISPVASDTFDYFYGNQLYSIGDDSSRMDGGYTIYLSREQLPYIFAKTNGSASDAITLAHEFGHFTAFHAVPSPHPAIDSGNLDLEETHSQGLQLLFTEKADALFGQQAESIKAYNVARVASAVLDGCIFDDWQREVYANPDMTLDEINACFMQTELDYGASYYAGLEYLWCDVSHNFESPMYYISYAISAFGALQIWSLSRDQYDQAVTAWERLIECGPYETDYASAMENAGLKAFYESGTADEILNNTLSYLTKAALHSSFY